MTIRLPPPPPAFPLPGEEYSKDQESSFMSVLVIYFNRLRYWIGDNSIYHIGAAYVGKPTSGIEYIRYPFVCDVTFPQGLVGSRGVAKTAATSTAVFNFSKNGTPIATMTFAPGGTVATFAMSAETSFSNTDILVLSAPNPADATLSDIGFVIAGTR